MEQIRKREWHWASSRDDSRFWFLSAVFLGLLSFIEGIRLPNSWSATQALINYDFGIVKRGLFGATFGNWLHLEHYQRFSVFSYALMALLVAVLALLVRLSGAMKKLGRGEPVAVFFASYAFTYTANLVGYLDIPLAIVTVVLLLVRDARLRALAAAPLCIVGILIHEMFFLVFLPVILFSFFADGFELTSRRERLRIWVIGGLVAVLSFGTTLWLALERPMTQAQLSSLRREIERKADFSVTPWVFPVFLHSTADNLRIMRGMLHNRGWMIHTGIWLAGFLPAMVLLCAAIRVAVITSRPPKDRGPLLFAALAAALSPLLMYLFGYDSARWDTLVCLDAFLVLMVLAKSMSADSSLFSGTYRVAAIVVMLLSIATGGVLFERKPDNTAPFVYNLRALPQQWEQHGVTRTGSAH